MDYSNNELELAYDIIENTGTSLFLTGKAGTGKTTFLRRLRERTQKNIVVLAPTGIAAINAGGQTIHSFFQLSFSPFVPGVGMAEGRKGRYRFSKDKLAVIRNVDVIVIDEISMVRADLLDAVDDALKRHRRNDKPFGGVQMLLIGDLAQLPPVVKEDEWQLLGQYYETPYFFSSLALAATSYEIIELKKVYRQEEGEFLDLLNQIRSDDVDWDTIEDLNRRYIPDFKAPEGEKWIRLVTHNLQADRINEASLAKLPGKARVYTAKMSGDFPEYSNPADMELSLKTGAQVMFLRNDSSGESRYYNGMIGEVTELKENAVTVMSASDGAIIEVKPDTWENTKYQIDPVTNGLKETVTGQYTQIPLRKAWAITIHKSQGLTFDHAIIDASASFAHGQTYVALSRCRTLEGLVLDRPLTLRSVICDRTVTDFLHNHLKDRPDSYKCEQLRRDYLSELTDELFDFSGIMRAADSMERTMKMHFYTTYPALTRQWSDERERLASEVIEVSRRFAGQYHRMIAQEAEAEALQERVRKGAEYFLRSLDTLKQLLADTPLEHDSKDVTEMVKRQGGELRELLTVKEMTLLQTADYGMTTAGYLKTKRMATGALDNEKRRAVVNKRRKGLPGGSQDGAPATMAQKRTVPTDDNLNPELYETLKAWRLNRANGQPAFTVASNRQLLTVSNALPADEAELLSLSGIGKSFLSKYGKEMLEMVDKYIRRE